MVLLCLGHLRVTSIKVCDPFLLRVLFTTVQLSRLLSLHELPASSTYEHTRVNLSMCGINTGSLSSLVLKFFPWGKEFLICYFLYVSPSAAQLPLKVNLSVQLDQKPKILFNVRLV